MKIINQNSFNQIIPILSSKYPELSNYFNTKFKKYLLKEYCEKVGFICENGLYHICSGQVHANDPRFHIDYWTSSPLTSKTFKVESMSFDNLLFENISIEKVDAKLEPLYLFDIDQFNMFLNQKFISLIWVLLQHPKYQEIGTINLVNNDLFKVFSMNMLQFNCKATGLHPSEVRLLIKKFNIANINIIELKTKNDFIAAGALMANCLGSHVRENTFFFKHKIIQNKCYGIAAIKYRKILFFDYILEMSGYNNHNIKNKNSFFNILLKLNRNCQLYLIISLMITFIIDTSFFLGWACLAYSFTSKSFGTSIFRDGFLYAIIVFLLPSIIASIDSLWKVIQASSSILFKKIK